MHRAKLYSIRTISISDGTSIWETDLTGKFNKLYWISIPLFKSFIKLPLASYVYSIASLAPVAFQSKDIAVVASHGVQAVSIAGQGGEQIFPASTHISELRDRGYHTNKTNIESYKWNQFASHSS